MAAGSTSTDALLADAVGKLDALNKRMDALETKPGSRNPIKGDDDDDKKDDAVGAKSDDDDDDKRDDGGRRDSRKDAARPDDDDDKKDDAATAPKTKILDSAKAASKTDAAKPAPAMKGDTAKKSDDGELEIKHGKGKDDSAKADDDDDKKDDAFPPKKGEEKDDDDDDKKDDSARADAVAELRAQIRSQQTVIDRLQAMMKPRTDDEHAAFADAQARADAVFNGFGQRAPRPLEGESLVDYRTRLATKLKMHSPIWKNSKLSKLDENTFGIAESAIYADAEMAAANPVDLGAGELRMVTKVDAATGIRQNVFYGKESFVKGMGRPGRRVQSFRTMASQ